MATSFKILVGPTTTTSPALLQLAGLNLTGTPIQVGSWIPIGNTGATTIRLIPSSLPIARDNFLLDVERFVRANSRVTFLENGMISISQNSGAPVFQGRIPKRYLAKSKGKGWSSDSDSDDDDEDTASSDSDAVKLSKHKKASKQTKGSRGGSLRARATAGARPSLKLNRREGGRRASLSSDRSREKKKWNMGGADGDPPADAAAAADDDGDDDDEYDSALEEMYNDGEDDREGDGVPLDYSDYVVPEFKEPDESQVATLEEAEIGQFIHDFDCAARVAAGGKLEKIMGLPSTPMASVTEEGAAVASRLSGTDAGGLKQLRKRAREMGMRIHDILAADLKIRQKILGKRAKNMSSRSLASEVCTVIVYDTLREQAEIQGCLLKLRDTVHRFVTLYIRSARKQEGGLPKSIAKAMNAPSILAQAKVVQAKLNMRLSDHYEFVKLILIPCLEAFKSTFLLMSEAVTAGRMQSLKNIVRRAATFTQDYGDLEEPELGFEDYDLNDGGDDDAPETKEGDWYEDDPDAEAQAYDYADDDQGDYDVETE